MEFTEPQRKTVASALTLLSVGVIVLFAVIAVWGIVAVLSYASAAITPLVIGLFLAMFFKPYYYWWLKTVKNPSLAVLLMLLSMVLPTVCLVCGFGSFAIEQISALFDLTPEHTARFKAWFNSEFPNAISIADKIELPYQAWITAIRTKCVQFVFNIAGYATNLLSVLVSLVFFVYFITRPSLKGIELANAVPFFKEDTKQFVAEQIDSFIDIVISFARRQMSICLIEGFLYGMGFYLIDLKYGFWIGFALGVFNFVPFMGTVVFLPVALLMAYFGSDGSKLSAMLVGGVWMIGQFLDGYIITPKIQGDKTGLGYAGVIFSFFFWGIVFNSLLGLLLAIPLSAFCLVLWRAIKAKYIKPVL